MSTSVQPEPFDPDKALAAVGGPAPSPGSVAGSDTSGFDPDKALADVGGPAKTDDESGSNDSGLMAGISGAAKGLMYGFDKDIAPAAAWAAERLTGQQPAASYAQLKNSYAQHQANEAAAHPVASTAGEVAGLVASPANPLVNAAAAAVPGAGLGSMVARGAIGGALSGGLYGAGNSSGPVLQRAGAAVKGAAMGLPVGAALGPVAETAGNMLANRGVLRPGVNTGQLAQTIDQSITSGKAAAQPLWQKADAVGDALVSGPEIDDLLNAPDAPKAWAAANARGLNASEEPLPPFPKAAAPVSGDLRTAIRADNPGWSDAHVEAAASDPDIASGYGSGALGGGGAGTRVPADVAFRSMNIPQGNLADMRAAGFSDDQILNMAAKVTKQPVPVTAAPRASPPSTAPAGPSRITDGAIPLRALQAMKRYLNGQIQSARASNNSEAADNATALMGTLGRAVDAAKVQYPEYGAALDASQGYMSLKPVQKAVQGILTPQQYLAGEVAGGRIAPADAETFANASVGPGRKIAAEGAGAAGLTMAGHPFLGIGMASRSLFDLAKAIAGGRMTDAQVASVVQTAQKAGATPRLAGLVRSLQARPTAAGRLLPNAARAIAAKSGAP